MGLNPWLALIAAAFIAGAIAIPISLYALKLKGGEFAIATWVIAEVVRICVMFDPLVQGDTGNSLIALNAYAPDVRRDVTYWLGLVAMAGFLVLTFRVLRSKTGSAAQAVRDDEEAALSVGVSVMQTKRIIFVLAASARRSPVRSGLRVPLPSCRAPILGYSGRCSCCSWCWSAACAPSRGRSSAL